MLERFSSNTCLFALLGIISVGTLGCTDFVEHQRQGIGTQLQIAIAASDSLAGQRAILTNAVDLIANNQGKQALQKLDSLEDKYSVLAPYILLKRGQAYDLELNRAKARSTWLKLVEKYPDSPAVADAFYFLGQENYDYWDQAIAKFPQHHRTHQIIWQLLEQNPDQPQLMKILVKFAADDNNIVSVSDRLMTDYSSQLNAEDWQALGDIYWTKWKYDKAAKAYAQAPRNARHLYRTARGYHLVKDKKAAKNYYRQLITSYPDDNFTGWGLRRFATLVDNKTGLQYLDQAIAKFPKHAPQALIAKAEILDKLNSPVSAQKAREQVLTQYSSSDAAAEYRWSVASKKAKAGNFLQAWQWSQPIVVNNSRHSLAPKAAFWIGKWAKKLGHAQDAEQAFKTTLANFPHSYYAWRSAIALGWDVGDFTSVRHKQPKIVTSSVLNPPGGSQVFRELYKAGLSGEAWGQFQLEISDQDELSLADQFTQGVMRISQGKNLRGINQLYALGNLDDPENSQQITDLKNTPEYWQSLYPFPFEENILKFSRDRNLNPLLVTSLIRQESRFEPQIKSSAGALGLMQVIPPTAKSVAQQLGLRDYSLTNPKDNIKIGTFYLDYTHKKYNNNSMLAVASYNAGPNAVARWVNRYGLADEDEFVEKIPYAETKGYVEKVFENYWNYLQVYNPQVRKMLQNI